MRRSQALALLAAPVLFGAAALTCAPDAERGADGPPPGREPPSAQRPTPLLPATPPVEGPPNPIPAENALPGDPSWPITHHAGPTLQAYASETSVNKGERIGIHVRAEAPQSITWTLYRLGWYGGDGARVVATSPEPVPVGPQPIPTPAPKTGLIECRWPETFGIETGEDWVTGAYLLKLKRPNGAETYATFVVRDDSRNGVAVVQLPATTWQAYNKFGGEGLYGSASGLSAGRAKEASFDRPYDQGDGSGQLLRFDRWFLEWAESRGYDMVYVTNLDFERDPNLLLGQRLFLSIGHDEYWTRTQREAVTRALSAGTSLAFFSANDAYWQIRMEPRRSDGKPARTQVCYKTRAPQEDPLRGTPLMTVRWRDPGVDEPENALLGVMYTDYQYVDLPWVVANATAWPYAGTGLSDGDVIPLIVGYESDRRFDNGRSPPGLVALSRSPTLTYRSTADWHEAATYDTPHGTFVFAAGTIQWSWGLAKPGFADVRVGRITENVFARAGLLPADEITPGTPATVAAEMDPEDAARPVAIFAGSPFAEGWTDGPALLARFRRPLDAVADEAGNVYVTDNGNHVVRRIANDAARTVTTIAGTGAPGLGTGPARSAALHAPSGIALRADGSLVVVDTGNHRVVRIARDPVLGEWTVEHLAGSPEGRSGIASGSATEARFQDPSGIATHGDTAYLADTTNNRLVRIEPDGAVSHVVGAGRGWVDGPGVTARVKFPTGLTATADGLWVVDSGNRVVRHVAFDGLWTTTTVAGHQWAEDGGFADGVASAARFMPQQGIAVAGAALIVADTGNNRVRRIQEGRVQTLAGSGRTRGGGMTAAEVALALPTAVAPLPGGGTVVVCQGDSTLRLLP